MAIPTRSKRGFAGMDPERQREIARKGGMARGKSQSENEVGQNQGNSNQRSGR